MLIWVKKEDVLKWSNWCILYLRYCINSYQYFQNRKMVALADLFFTTNKGIPDINNLPASITLAQPFYIYSIILQALILIFFLFYFAISIYRVVKKIKNYRFEQISDANSTDEQADKNGKNPSERNNGENQHEKEDKLIYRFDDQQEDYDEKPKEGEENQENDKEDKEDQAKEDEQKQKEENYDNYHDQNEEAFIEFEDKLLFMQPFLISFIVCNGLFTTDPSTIVLFVLTILSFFLFNIKGKLPNVKSAKISFMVFSLLGYLAFFYKDHDITT